MDPDIKNVLRERITEHVSKNTQIDNKTSFSIELTLPDLIQNAYLRQYDGKTQLSSYDMAYAISSLLEHPNIAGDSRDSNENRNPNSKD